MFACVFMCATCMPGHNRLLCYISAGSIVSNMQVWRFLGSKKVAGSAETVTAQQLLFWMFFFLECHAAKVTGFVDSTGSPVFTSKLEGIFTVVVWLWKRLANAVCA